MFPPKKKKGLDVMIAVGKPKGGLEAPDPVDSMAKRHLREAKAGKAPTVEHEAEESPEYEAQEEYGAKIVRDIEAAGESLGLDAEQSHVAAAAFLKAIANCLKGGEEEAEASEEEAEGEEY